MNRIFINTYIVLCLIFTANLSFAQKKNKISSNNPERLTHDLSGYHWKVQGTLPGRGLEEKFPEISYDHMGDALNWATAHVPGKLGDQFHVALKLTNSLGELISENKYLLLVGDEKVDLPRLRKIGKEARDKKAMYGSHNYLRYFEGLNGARGVKQADEKMPTVKEFDKN